MTPEKKGTGTFLSRWSYEDAERYLLDLELFGMRFGLDRMRRLMTALDSPQERFESVHVVGTNGKSSTARMIAAILERHGRRTGAYLSPHLRTFAERVRIGEHDLDPALFGAAVQRASRAAELVDRTLSPGDRVTQFEALTAAAYSEMARHGVDVAVVEAGLGGRFDATNVIPSAVQVLTTVGLEHTRWLGPTVRDIAREKLDVVREGATLVLGDVPPEAEDEARAIAETRGARITKVPGTKVPLEADVPLLGAFQRRNFAVARAAAEALVGPLDDDAVRAAAASVQVPGRMQVVASEPTTVLDGAHNPSGMAALAESLAELTHSGTGGERRVVAAISILDDKDAPGMLRALLPRCAHLVLTSNANPRALPPATLQSLARQLARSGTGGGPPSEVEPDPRRALERARELAGRDGVALATGSIYLIADLVRETPGRRASSL